ncbi:unnamed protein product (macronuclear) [Paramecium tetraurelia]|uniref:Rab-GAP TBC domain-containing protein n=1 Tax=Paramecium tetraurelia TaxID=5888 RepID=A0E7F8_PARTE|nr:uncharacterized protein GSPATT00023953001 [Paramecium tetraurelia]CAK91225.1 unnamed protein product [Paramecium tetraurelia]|eukprot:XP_001458622.1 hypothetical protein (macronuclear) [Paramecium tetraurelia strain d4-2]
MKGDMQKNEKKGSLLNVQIKYFQLFNEEQELVRICTNSYSCVNSALKCVLREKVQSQPLKQFWRMLSNIKYNQNSNPCYYQNLQNIQHFPPQFQEIIKKDVDRTTQDEECRVKLSSVLNAYSIRNAQVGYCQGFNYIAYYFLQHFNEEETFWFLCHLFETILPPNYYNHLYGVQCDDFIIKDLIVFLRPQLISHMQKLQVETSLFTIQWLVCCFTFHNQLSETIIDLLLLDGSKALIKCVLTYLNFLEPILLQCEDIGSFIISIENFIQSYQDREQFVKEYNRLYINNKILQFVRQDYSRKVVTMIQQRSNQIAKQLDTYLLDLKQKKCNLESPVCQYILETWTRNKRHLDFIIIQEQNIKIIQDYEQTKNRKSILDKNDQLIFRQKHICQSDDIILIREIQYSDVQDVEFVNIKQIQKNNQVSKRARSPIKEILLFPLKAFNQKEQEQKLKMNPQKYKIEPYQIQRSVKSVQPQQSPNSVQYNRARSPQYRRSYQPKDMSHSQHAGSTQRTQIEEPPTIRQSITIQFLAELSKNTGLINLEFEYQ